MCVESLSGVVSSKGLNVKAASGMEGLQLLRVVEAISNPDAIVGDLENVFKILHCEPKGVTESDL